MSKDNPYQGYHAQLLEKLERLERENAALREAKDAYFKYNKILVMLITEEQKKKALEILMSRPKEAQP